MGVELVAGAKVEAITPAGVRYAKDGEELVAAADTVLYATGMKPNDEVYFELAAKAPHVVMVGDCKAVGKVSGAIHGGYFAAMAVGR